MVGIETRERYGIGPYPDMYGHGPVLVFTPPGERGAALFACLDCGYVAADNRLFLHTDCGREHNPINQTMRELVEKEGFPDPPAD